tara:strand:- start:263 stop:793 length:531 start_codon:yes stop_codon:yes gene_type:complete
MPTPSECVNKYRRLSNEDFAIWYGHTLGIGSGLSVCLANRRTRKGIQSGIDALVPAPVEEVVEEVVEEAVEVESVEDIPNTEDFPSDLSYDAMTLIELREECKSRGLAVSGTKAQLSLRLKRNDEGISESTTGTEAPAEEAAAEVESDTPAEEAAVTNGETNAETTEQGNITETAE